MIDNTRYTKRDYYLGNPGVRRAGSTPTKWSKGLMAEYVRCREDVEYFCSRYVKVVHLDRGLVNFVPYPYQSVMWDNFRDERFNVVLACRQSGKTLAVVGFLLHYCLFHSEQTVAVVAHKASQAREILSRFTFALENLPFWLQPGCKTLNKSRVDFDNNTSIFAEATSSGALRGRSCNLVYLDEFAFVEHDVEFMTSTYPVISSGKTSKVIITSTANGIGNEFHRIYQGSVDGVNTYKYFRVDWWDVPGRDEDWKKQQIANTSTEQFNQEFGNQFIGSSDTLIDAKTLIRLRSDLPLWTSSDGTKVYEKPVDGRSYVITVDTAKGRGKDYSTFSAFDVTDLPYRQVATYRDSNISPMWFPNLVAKWGEAYNDAFVVVESNDEGVTVARGLYYDIEYENMFNESMIKSGKLGIEVTKKVKRIGCSKFKDILESDKLWVRDPDSIKELTTFVQKGTSYEASDANHDDMVSNLWLFGWVTDLDDFDEISKGINLKDAMFGDNIENLTEELFFGVIDDGMDDEETPITVSF